MINDDGFDLQCFPVVKLFYSTVYPTIPLMLPMHCRLKYEPSS